MALTEVARDPFARSSLLRQSEPGGKYGASCTWCGQSPRTLYRYAYSADGAMYQRPYWSAPFCNLACRQAYQ